MTYFFWKHKFLTGQCKPRVWKSEYEADIWQQQKYAPRLPEVLAKRSKSSNVVSQILKFSCQAMFDRCLRQAENVFELFCNVKAPSQKPGPSLWGGGGVRHPPGLKTVRNLSAVALPATEKIEGKNVSILSNNLIGTAAYASHHIITEQ